MVKLNVPRFKQTKMMCGPYALKQIFAYYGDDIDIKEIIKKTKARIDYGLWLSSIISLAKERNYKINFHTNSLKALDFSWERLSSKKIVQKLKRRLKSKKKQVVNYKGFIEYFSKGGKVDFRPITKELVKKYLDKKIPVLISVNSTYFYKRKRKYKDKFDDIKGSEVGHFLVIAGYDKNRFYVVDPNFTAPKNGKYWVKQDYLIVSTLILGGHVIILRK